MPKAHEPLDVRAVDGPYQGNLARQVADYFMDVSVGLFAPQDRQAFFEGFNDNLSNTDFRLASSLGTPAGTLSDYPWPTAALPLRAVSNSANDDVAGSGARSVILATLDDDLNEQAYILPLAGNDTSDNTTPGNSIGGAASGDCRRINFAGVLAGGTYRPLENVDGSGSNDADIIIENTGGVELMKIPGRHGVSRGGNFTIPAGHSAGVEHAAVLGEVSKAVSLRNYVSFAADITTPPFGATFIGELTPQADSSLILDFNQTKGIIPQKSDFIIKAKGLAGGSTIAVRVVFRLRKL